MPPRINRATATELRSWAAGRSLPTRMAMPHLTSASRNPTSAVMSRARLRARSPPPRVNSATRSSWPPIRDVTFERTVALELVERDACLGVGGELGVPEQCLGNTLVLVVEDGRERSE